MKPTNGVNIATHYIINCLFDFTFEGKQCYREAGLGIDAHHQVEPATYLSHIFPSYTTERLNRFSPSIGFSDSQYPQTPISADTDPQWHLASQCLPSKLPSLSTLPIATTIHRGPNTSWTRPQWNSRNLLSSLPRPQRPAPSTYTP